MKTFSAITIAFAGLAAAIPAPRPAVDAADANSAIVATLFPNYLVPIKEATPGTAYPTQYTGQIAYWSDAAKNETRMLVGFDVPANGATQCAIKFTYPPRQQFEQYPWVVTGTGALDVYQLSSIIDNGVTAWSTKPGRTTTAPVFKIKESLDGGDAVITGGPVTCAGGQRMDFEFLVTRPGPAGFDWFELSSPKTGITLDMSTA